MSSKVRAPWKWIGLAVVLVVAAAVTIGVFVARAHVSSVSRLLELGQSYLADGDYEQAAAAFEEALSIDPKNPDAYLGLADAYVGLGDPEGAIELLEYGYELTGDARLVARLEELRQGLADGTYVQNPVGSRAAPDRRRWGGGNAAGGDEGGSASGGESGEETDSGASVQDSAGGAGSGDGQTVGADGERAVEATNGGETADGAADAESGGSADSADAAEMTGETSGAGALYDAIRMAGHYQLFGRDMEEWTKESITAYIRANGAIESDGADERYGRNEYYQIEGVMAHITTGATAEGYFNDVTIADAGGGNISAGGWQIIFREYNGASYHFVTGAPSGLTADYALLGMSMDALAAQCGASDVWEDFEQTVNVQDGMKQIDVGEGRMLAGYNMAVTVSPGGGKYISISFQDGRIFNINYGE